MELAPIPEHKLITPSSKGKQSYQEQDASDYVLGVSERGEKKGVLEVEKHSLGQCIVLLKEASDKAVEHELPSQIVDDSHALLGQSIFQRIKHKRNEDDGSCQDCKDHNILSQLVPNVDEIDVKACQLACLVVLFELGQDTAIELVCDLLFVSKNGSCDIDELLLREEFHRDDSLVLLLEQGDVGRGCNPQQGQGVE